MGEEQRKNRYGDANERLYLLLSATAVLLLVFGVIAQPNRNLLTGLWRIQLSEVGLITDPMAIGGVGSALVNASLVMTVGIQLIRRLKLPFTGVSFACLFMLGGFALLGKNLINIAPIILGGWLGARYRDEEFSTVIYPTIFSTCLSPLVSFLMVNGAPGVRWVTMALGGIVIGFLVPPIARYTVRIHQGYSLYNVGFAAGFLGMGLASILKGLGVELHAHIIWSEDGHVLLCIMVSVMLAGLFAAGVAMGCRSVRDYWVLLHHSGRAVADFIIMDGPGRTLVNMALVGAIGFAYLLAVGVRLSGPLVCCLMSMMGFGAFGKHPRNITPVMAGAVLAALLLVQVPITAPGVLLATLLCTALAPIAGQFGWYWGVAAGFIHMTVVQNTSILHGGMNLYNNGFAAGMVCVLLIPVIEALDRKQKE